MTDTLAPALPRHVEAMAHAVLARAHAAGVTLATAESCTGGLLAALLTDVDGYGHVFERGFVAYSTRAKCQLLGLAAERIDRCGAVSRDTALAMAEGALRLSDAQVALAITGFAGRGGEGDEPGLVHLACARAGAATRHREEHFGDAGRGPVRLAALRAALEMLADAVEG